MAVLGGAVLMICSKAAVMGRRTRVRTALGVVAVLGSWLGAQGAMDRDFYADGLIGSGDSYGRVGVYDTPPAQTTLTMTGGSVAEMLLYDSSLGHLRGGLVQHLQTFDASTVDLDGVAVGFDFGACLTVRGDSCVNLSGGIVGLGFSGNWGEVYDRGKLTVDGGTIAAFLSIWDQGHLVVHSGCLSHLTAGGNARVDIYGGAIGDGWGAGFGSATTVNIYGTDFLYDPEWLWADENNPVWRPGWVSRLTGIGPQGVPIEIVGIDDPATSPHIHLIPEPCGMVLFALGFLLVGRGRA